MAGLCRWGAEHGPSGTGADLTGIGTSGFILRYCGGKLLRATFFGGLCCDSTEIAPGCRSLIVTSSGRRGHCRQAILVGIGSPGTC